MRWLGLTGRLILLLSVGFIILQAIMTVSYVVDRNRSTRAELWLPYADQLEAIVTLFDEAEADRRDLLLRAFSDGQLLLSLTGEEPAVRADAGDIELTGLAARLRDYSELLGDHEVRAVIPADLREAPFPRLYGFMAPDRIRIAVRLGDGTWLVLRRQDSGYLAVGGLPVGQLSGLLGALLAIVVIIAVWRETRPLRQLRAAAAHFGSSLQPQPVRPAGAPDVRDLIGAFNAMQARIVRLDHGRADMIAAIAHDVRTPLTRLRLRLRKLDPALQDAAGRDIDEITRVADEASRFAATEFAELDQTVDLEALLRSLDVDDRVSVEIAARPGGYPITGNPELLARCFGNLLANALAHGERCRISLSAEGADLLVTVDDDGPGIAPEERERLIQPFQRGDVSRSRSGDRATEGTGLGLAISNRVVRRHGGDLELADSDLGGLSVCIRFHRAARL